MTNVVTPGLVVTYVRSTLHMNNLGSGFPKRGKLYFTKDIVDRSFVPRNRKPKPIPKPDAKRAPKPAPKGKHVQLFKMRRKVGLLAHCILVPSYDNCAWDEVRAGFR